VEAKPQTEKLLEKLSGPQATAETKFYAPPAEKKSDDKKLESLSQPIEAKIPETKPKTEAKPVDLSKADEKLSSLLGKPKQ
jgi:hypothetical protein